MVVAGFPHPYTLGCWRVAFSLSSAVSPSPKLKKQPCPRAMRVSGAAHARVWRLTPPAQLRTTPKGHRPPSSRGLRGAPAEASVELPLVFSFPLCWLRPPLPSHLLEILPKQTSPMPISISASASPGSPTCRWVPLPT